MNDDYAPRDREYIRMHNEAARMVKAGEARAYSATHHPRMGRILHIETDQGWNPDPFYQEFPDD
jgi:hypothetical protein